MALDLHALTLLLKLAVLEFKSFFNQGGVCPQTPLLTPNCVLSRCDCRHCQLHGHQLLIPVAGLDVHKARLDHQGARRLLIREA